MHVRLIFENNRVTAHSAIVFRCLHGKESAMESG